MPNLARETKIYRFVRRFHWLIFWASIGALIWGYSSAMPRRLAFMPATSPGEAQRIPIPAIAWEKYRVGAPRSINSSLLAALDAGVARWEAKGAQFGVLRDRQKASHHAQTCFPFEEEHRSGQSLDIAVGDLNGDGKISLLDACLFAADLEAQGWRGGLGVYGHQTADGAVFWVHAGTQGRERWGGMRRSATQPVVWSARESSLAQRCRAAGVRRDALHLIVEKEPSVWRFDATEKTLALHPAVRVYAGQRLLKAYPAALGFDAVNDKQKLNDYRTPEGEFYLCERKVRSQFYRSLRLSYPNSEDASRGLNAGLIDKATQRAIERAIRRKRVPPQNTALGGNIMIHGGGGLGRNWTWGCIALENADIKELFEFIPLGTRVTVHAPRR